MSSVQIRYSALETDPLHRVWLNNPCGQALGKAEVEQAVVAASNTERSELRESLTGSSKRSEDYYCFSETPLLKV